MQNKAPPSASCPEECVAGLSRGWSLPGSHRLFLPRIWRERLRQLPGPGGRLFRVRAWRAKALGPWALR